MQQRRVGGPRLPMLGATRSHAEPTVLAKGFRPFFLLAALHAIVMLPVWLMALGGMARPGPFLPTMLWHGHEMVFGYTVAVIAGFLLTAVSRWTSRETAVGPLLGVLAVAWLVGRVALLVAPVSLYPVAALLDVVFLPLLVISVARPIVEAQNRRNFGFIGVLGALALLNLVFHAAALAGLVGVARRCLLVGLDGVVLLIIVISGRVIPMFTRNASGAAGVRSLPAVDRLAVAAMLLLTVVDAAAPQWAWTAVLALGVAALTAGRTIHWGLVPALRDPMLWVLHVGYLWVPVGLGLRGVSELWPVVPTAPAAHALTVGAIGMLTLGMMARVTLGHTGRPMRASRVLTVAFACMTLAAAVRVLLPLVHPPSYLTSMMVSGGLWTLAFALYLAEFTPKLLRPRVDGNPG